MKLFMLLAFALALALAPLPRLAAQPHLDPDSAPALLLFRTLEPHRLEPASVTYLRGSRVESKGFWREEILVSPTAPTSAGQVVIRPAPSPCKSLALAILPVQGLPLEVMFQLTRTEPFLPFGPNERLRITVAYLTEGQPNAGIKISTGQESKAFRCRAYPGDNVESPSQGGSQRMFRVKSSPGCWSEASVFVEGTPQSQQIAVAWQADHNETPGVTYIRNVRVERLASIVPANLSAAR